MSYAEILVLADETHACALRITTAAKLARRTGARLTGVFLRSDFIRMFGTGDMLTFMPPADLDLIMKQHAEALDAAAAKVRKAFEASAETEGVSHDWLEINGDMSDSMIALARRSDLTVFPSQAAVCLGNNRISASDIGMASGGPVIVLPEAGYLSTAGSKIMVAWNDSRESARALRDALPLLKVADEVAIVSVRDEPDEVADRWLKDRLELHGCKARLVVDRWSDASPGEVLKFEMGKTGSDLLVMGLYGRPRLQEIILGGVSREMLDTPIYPVLVSH
jgi:nucleotide-binding universal stress UspA family protein